MRLSSVVFCLYMLLLFAIPCGDTNEKNLCLTTKSDPCENKEKGHHNSCSPFCICDCCCQNIQAAVPHSMVSNTLGCTQEIQIEHIFLFLPDFYEIKWQPPKLS